MSHHDFLDKESKDRNTVKKKYTKLLNVCLGIEFFLIISELGMVGSSIALPAVIPFSVPISIGLTSCSIILRSSSRLIAQKINKHLEIESLARAKFNSIEEKFAKALQDGKITDEEFTDIEQEINNYENMKASILSKYNSGRTEVWDSLKNKLKK
jgi:ABC-type transport system involved in multi-copper enzyme maturation permease subunit